MACIHNVSIELIAHRRAECKRNDDVGTKHDHQKGSKQPSTYCYAHPAYMRPTNAMDNKSKEGHQARKTTIKWDVREGL